MVVKAPKGRIYLAVRTGTGATATIVTMRREMGFNSKIRLAK